MDILSTQEDEDLARAVALSLGEAGDTKESTSNSARAPREQLDKIKMDEDGSPQPFPTTNSMNDGSQVGSIMVFIHG